MPLFVVLGGLTWLLLRSAELDTSAIIIEMYRLKYAHPVDYSAVYFCWYGSQQQPDATRRVHCAGAHGLVTRRPGARRPGVLRVLYCFHRGIRRHHCGIRRSVVPPPRAQAIRNASVSLVTTCGSLGLLFPPSLPIILYGLVAQTPIDLLFIASFVPGLFLLLLLGLLSTVQAKRHKVPLHRSSQWKCARRCGRRSGNSPSTPRTGWTLWRICDGE